MFCPACESEYREGFTRCTSCDVPLVEKLEDDEVDESLPASLVPLADDHASDLIAELTERLESAGVPYLIQAGTALPLADGEVESLTEPAAWHARIWVVESMFNLARTILQELRDARH
jgi:hypothetical protein